MKKIIIATILLCMLPVFAKAQSGNQLGNRLFIRGIVDRVDLKLQYSTVEITAWGMLVDANGNAFDEPIAFYRMLPSSKNSPSNYFIATNDQSLAAWSDFAHVGELVRVEGREAAASDLVHKRFLCTRVVFENRELKGSIALVNKPKVSLPYHDGMQPCIRTEDGKEFVICDSDFSFAAYEGGGVVLAGQEYPLGAQLTVKGDVSQEYAIGVDMPRFFQIHVHEVVAKK